jgi:uncharacterized membrane protein
MYDIPRRAGAEARAMPPLNRHLRAIRRRAWALIALGLAGQIASATLYSTPQSGDAAQAAPIMEMSR